MSNLQLDLPVDAAEELRTNLPAGLPLWRRSLAFGTGFGISIGTNSLEAAIVRARPWGPTLLATTTIKDFRSRPAADWGATLLRFLAVAKEPGLAATLLLPRSEVIVRTLHLPGVANRYLASAIELRIDTLHPWDDSDILWSWSRTDHDASKHLVQVGVVRKKLLDSYKELFFQAGVPLSAAAFSSTLIHAALRVWSEAPASVLCFTHDGGRTEVYGEGESRAVLSAEFNIARERAIMLARAELRMSSDRPALPLSEVLPVFPGTKLVGNPLAYAAAIAGSVPRVAAFANLLPANCRGSHDRLRHALPGTLGILVTLALVGVFLVFPAIERKRYRDRLEQEEHKLEPTVSRVVSLEQETRNDQTKALLLNEVRRRPQADLDVLNELTRLLPPPIWTSSIEIYPDSVVITGEADQAAPLLKILDASSQFQNSEFALPLTRGDQIEQFRIKTTRRGRAGRSTP